MIERGRGAILNVSSLAAFQPVPYLGAYAATKAYVLFLSEALEEEVRDKACACSRSAGPRAHRVPERRRTSIEGLRGRTAVSPERCVDEALAGLDEGRSIVVPGLPNRLLAATVGFLPRRRGHEGRRRAYRKRGESA